MDSVPTASELWLLLDGQRTVAEIVEVLATKYSTAPDTMHQKVTPLLEQLANNGLLIRPDKEK